MKKIYVVILADGTTYDPPFMSATRCFSKKSEAKKYIRDLEKNDSDFASFGIAECELDRPSEYETANFRKKP